MSSAEIDGKPGSPFIEFFTVEQAATATYLPVQRLEPDPGGYAAVIGRDADGAVWLACGRATPVREMLQSVLGSGLAEPLVFPSPLFPLVWNQPDQQTGNEVWLAFHDLWE